MANDSLPSDYSAFLKLVKDQVQTAQLKALMSVNRELILLYWNIGKQILKRQQREGWGAKIIDNLSKDLHASFPEMKGFSPRNLKYMRAFAGAYTDEQFVQTVSAQITWSHNTLILDKVKDPDERCWYIQKSAQFGWSHNVLGFQIDTKLYHREGKALTNFKDTLPALDSDLAQDVLKDPYVFDFITTNDETKERNLQSALIAHIERFLLELGIGFTFVGSNYHLKVGENDFYIDLLFYHVNLRCYIVIELKTGDFKPEYAGKLNFYLTAVDKQIKHPDDSPSIGIILCKAKDKATAEYAVQNIRSPLGIATYETTIELPGSLKDQLPNVRELEQSLEQVKEKTILTYSKTNKCEE